MTYRQLTPEERYMLAALRRQGLSRAEIARLLGRHRSTVCRELRRNSTRADGRYRASTAQERTNGRRSRSRRNRRFSAEDFALVDRMLGRQWSPEQVAGHLRRTGRLAISHETIYRHVWHDKREGGLLYTHLRGARKKRRKRYGAYDSRGRLAGKRMIAECPAEVEARESVGHWEADTVAGSGSKDCVVTLVERKSGLVLIGKLADRTAEGLSRGAVILMRGRGARFETVTADNGTEFHDYQRIERLTGAAFYFARPVPLVGAREQRERQRAAAPVPAERSEHGGAQSAAVQRHRPQTQHATPEAAGLPDAARMLQRILVSVAVQT